jgi:hypothetical protein
MRKQRSWTTRRWNHPSLTNHQNYSGRHTLELTRAK